MAEDGLGTRRGLDADEVRADRDTAVGADFDVGALTPNERPPRALGNGTQHGTFFFKGKFPCLLGLHFQFAVSFVLVAMETQLVDMRIGLVEVGDLFAGEVSRQTILPEGVSALDFAFGLRGRSVAKGDAVKVKRVAQLGKSLWCMGEEHRMVIDIELERQPVFHEGGREEIKVGEQVFRLVNSGGGKDPAAIIEHVDHGE